MPLLNGKLVDASEIDPAKHKYIGSFREPWEILDKRHEGYVVQCRCGHVLETHQGFFNHYLQGHLDIEQYVSLEPNEKKE